MSEDVPARQLWETAESQALYETVDGVCTITLNRPDRLNALTPQMLEELACHLHAAQADPAVRVVIVTGAGKGFCSGADLALLDMGAQALDGFASDFDAASLFAFTLSMTKPVVMAVNGPAAGAGFVLTLIGDVRFASDSALFLSAFSRLGLTAEYGAAWLLPRIISPGLAREILLSGRLVDAREAERIGLVNAVGQDALELAKSWAQDVAASCSPSSLATMKSQLAAAVDQDFATHLDQSIEWMTRSFRWPDLAEALAARAEKRAPHFPDLTTTDDDSVEVTAVGKP